MASGVTNFRKEFKRYKRKGLPPDLSEVIDFNNQSTWKGRAEECDVFFTDEYKHDIPQFGLKRVDTWRCFKLRDHQGFKVIANPFTNAGQLHWIQQCLENYPGKPNVCNLDAHISLGNDTSLWKCYEQHHLSKLSGLPLEKSKQFKPLMDQLRWVTLGYHYNWDLKLYSQDSFAEFPLDSGNLSKCISAVMGYPDFVPEAAIINYYHMDSTLSGHTDHSELDLTAPLFSLSFGQSCIFLLGTQSQDDVPCAMFLRSGDIVVMSGDSRLAYHAVPKILADRDIVQRILSDKDDAPGILPDKDIPRYSTDEDVVHRNSADKDDVPRIVPDKNVVHRNSASKSDISRISLERCAVLRKLPYTEANHRTLSETDLEQSIAEHDCLRESDETFDKMRRIDCLKNYLSYSRININVRQVQGPGKTFSHKECNGYR